VFARQQLLDAWNIRYAIINPLYGVPFIHNLDFANALMWRLDKNYLGLQHEVPWLKQLPSEYLRQHFRATTQPMEEPPEPRHLLNILEMIGSDHFLMFATDYPHWDFDAPDGALPSIISPALQERIFATNAAEFYDFDRK